MNTDEEILQLLREIRDGQREVFDFVRRWKEERDREYQRWKEDRAREDKELTAKSEEVNAAYLEENARWREANEEWREANREWREANKRWLGSTKCAGSFGWICLVVFLGLMALVALSKLELFN